MWRDQYFLNHCGSFIYHSSICQFTRPSQGCQTFRMTLVSLRFKKNSGYLNIFMICWSNFILNKSQHILVWCSSFCFNSGGSMYIGFLIFSFKCMMPLQSKYFLSTIYTSIKLKFYHVVSYIFSHSKKKISNIALFFKLCFSYSLIYISHDSF